MSSSCSYPADEMFFPPESLQYQGPFSSDQPISIKRCPHTFPSLPLKHPLKVGIMTCGGLAPGLNAVMYSLIETLEKGGVKSITGIPYGFQGFCPEFYPLWQPLDSQMMLSLAYKPGSHLGVSRGFFDPQKIAIALQHHQINCLFLLGGDGTLTAAHILSTFLQTHEPPLPPIQIIGIPKTIDNDIPWVSKSFGFDTAVEKAAQSIKCALAEAKSAYRGLGLVKIMGRHSGFLAANAAATIPGLDAVLIPEVPVTLEGSNGLIEYIQQRLNQKRYCTIVVAEGAGLRKDREGQQKFPSYLKKLPKFGEFLQNYLPEYFEKSGQPIILRYIDSSYMQRAQSPSTHDQLFCHLLGQRAAWASLHGHRDCMISELEGEFVLIPLDWIAHNTRQLDLNSDLWSLVLTMTKQPGEWGVPY